MSQLWTFWDREECIVPSTDGRLSQWTVVLRVCTIFVHSVLGSLCDDQMTDAARCVGVRSDIKDTESIHPKKEPSESLVPAPQAPSEEVSPAPEWPSEGPPFMLPLCFS